MTEGAPAAQEPWDLEAFVRAYDALAKTRGGWRWDRASPTTAKLQGWYEAATIWRTPADLAEARFMLEQQY